MIVSALLGLGSEKKLSATCQWDVRPGVYLRPLAFRACFKNRNLRTFVFTGVPQVFSVSELLGMWLVAVIILVQDVKESKLETRCFCGSWREQPVICSLFVWKAEQPALRDDGLRWSCPVWGRCSCKLLGNGAFNGTIAKIIALALPSLQGAGVPPGASSPGRPGCP